MIRSLDNFHTKYGIYNFDYKRDVLHIVFGA